MARESSAREFGSVGVVGLGTMGAGIVEVFARHGIAVLATEVNDAALERGRAVLTASTDRAVRRGKLTEADRDALLSRVTFSVGFAALSEVDLVVEAVPERLELKQTIFAELDRVCKPGAILASNTSSLSVTEISVATRRPDQVIGMHFFNPAPVMKLVEVVRTVITAADVVADIEALCGRLGKVDVTIEDRAGFIANGLLFGYLNHAAALFADRYVSREDLDTAMRLGGGLPMGPLALMDLIGLDTTYEILDTMYRRGGRDRRHAPVPLLKQMVTAGLLGRKSGRGFFTYQQPGSSKVIADELTPEVEPTGPAESTVQVEPTGRVEPTDAAELTDADKLAGLGDALMDELIEELTGPGDAPAGRPRTAGVVGSGSLAIGLIEVFVRAGYQVTSVSAGVDTSARLAAALVRSLAEAARRGELTEAEQAAATARVSWAGSLDRLADVDLVIEAVPEDLAVKRTLFASLDEICKPGVLLATTTASLPVIEIAMATGRPASVVGLHFFEPTPATSLVEVVHTLRTSDETRAAAKALVAALGRTGVVCADRAGFVVNALLFPYLNDAIRMLEANYADAEDIDNAMKLGCGYPTGPIELLDRIGLDVALAIQRTLYQELREPGLAPAPLLEHLVTAGYLGRKAGRGFRGHGDR